MFSQVCVYSPGGISGSMSFLGGVSLVPCPFGREMGIQEMGTHLPTPYMGYYDI